MVNVGSVRLGQKQWAQVNIRVHKHDREFEALRAVLVGLHSHRYAKRFKN